MAFYERYLGGCAAWRWLPYSLPRRRTPQDGSAALHEEAAQEHWLYLSRHLQVLPLQRPRPDQYRQRQESRSCLNHFSGARHPWSAVHAAGH